MTAAGEPKQLTKDDAFSVREVFVFARWEADCIRAQRDPDLISSFSEDIYTVTVADGAVKKIVDTPGPDSNPQWSPDGTQIAYVTSNGSKYFFYTNQQDRGCAGADGGTPRVRDERIR